MILFLYGCAGLGPWQGPADDSASDIRISLSPSPLDFGSVSVWGEGSRTLELSIFNLSQQDVEITGHDEPLGDSAFSVDAPPILHLDAQSETLLPIAFRPPHDGSFSADLLVRPSEEILHLTGIGTAPILQMGELSLPAVVVGCSGEGSITLQNTGHETLHLSELHTTTDEFSVIGYPLDLAPDASDRIDLRFSPTGSGERGSTLQIRSDDPLYPLTALNLSALGYEGERVTEGFHYYPSNPTDILWLISTPNAAERAEAAAPAYVDSLRERNVDYRLSAIAGTSPCPPGLPAWATRSDTSYTSLGVIGRALREGSGSWDNQLLDLGLAALNQSQVGGCLEGFRRSDADLEIVLITADPGGSIGAETLSSLQEIAGEKLRISGLLPTSCGTSIYTPLVTENDGQLTDACEADWTLAMQSLSALPAAAHPVSYILQEKPVEGTITVTVEGITWSTWHYDVGSNAIILDDEPTPSLGAEVSVSYVSAVVCQ